MTSRNFTVTVKEREVDQPCFLVFELNDDLGLGDRSITLNLRAGTDIEDAKNIARSLNAQVERIHLAR